MPNFDFFSLVQQCGFPIALAMICGWFVMQAIKLVLGSVVKSIKKMTFLIKSMDMRVRQMNVDVIEIDKLISMSLGVDALPMKVHHEVAAIMNSHDNIPTTSTSPPIANKKLKDKIKDKIKDTIENAVDKNVDKILDRVESITK